MKNSNQVVLKWSLVAATIVSSAIISVKADQPKIEVKGLTRKIIAEQVLSGPLTELNGKYKMVAVEFAIAPGGYVGPHLHAVRDIVASYTEWLQTSKLMGKAPTIIPANVILRVATRVILRVTTGTRWS